MFVMPGPPSRRKIGVAGMRRARADARDRERDQPRVAGRAGSRARRACRSRRRSCRSRSRSGRTGACSCPACAPAGTETRSVAGLNWRYARPRATTAISARATIRAGPNSFGSGLPWRRPFVECMARRYERAARLPSSRGPDFARTNRRVASPTPVGGGSRAAGVRSPREPARPLVRRYGFDALIVVAALESAARGRGRRDDGRRAAHDALVRRPGDRGDRPAAARAPALPVRRAGRPSGCWRAALSFVDGRLVVFTARRLAAGLAAAFLLGNLARRASRRGSASRSSSAARRSSSTTTRTTRPSEFVFIPVLFAIGWLAGFALRERAEQAEAAEDARGQAEREREAAARVAVAEERARIARELHDIVAHAVSVMVLQVGAVRHRLAGDARGRPGRARATSSEPGRTRARGDAPPARRDAQRRRRASSSRRSRASTSARRAARRGRAAPACRCSCTSRASPCPLPRGARPLGLPDRPGGPHERAQARARQPRRRASSATGADELRDRGARRRPGPRDERRRSATGCVGDPRAGQDLRRRDDRRAAPNGGGFVLSDAPSRSRAAPDDHPRPRRRRPVDGPRGLPHAARGRAGHRGGRRGENGLEAVEQAARFHPTVVLDGHPDARARRPRGHAAHPRGGRRRARILDPHDVRPRRVRLRGAAGRAPAASCSRTTRPSS